MKARLTEQERAVLQQRLAEAEGALHQLQTGKLATTVLYQSGDGTKSASFSRTNIGQLRIYIGELKRKLGLAPRRFALRPVFGGGPGRFCR